MKKRFLLFGFCFLPVFLMAQEIPFKVQKSAVFKDEYKETQVMLSETEANGNLFLVRQYKGGMLSTSEGFYIERYDSELKLVKDFDFQIKHSVSEKNAIVVGVVKFENQLNIVEFYFDLVQKAYVCVAHSIDVTNFTVADKPLFLLSRDEAKKYGSFSLMGLYYNAQRNIGATNRFVTSENSPEASAAINGAVTNFNASENQKNSAIDFVVNKEKTAFSVILDLNGKDSEVLKLYLFDKKLQKKIENLYTKDNKDGKFHFQNAELPPDGNSIYVIGKVFTKEDKSKQKGGKYQFEITKFTGDQKLSQYLETDEHYINGLKIVMQKNQLVCLGFYSDSRDPKFRKIVNVSGITENGRFKGLVCYTLDAQNLQLKTAKFNPFTEQFLIDKYGKVSDKELKNLVIKDVFVTDTNQTIITAEEVYISTTFSGTGPGMGMASQTFYNYDDIVTAKIGEDGTMIWARNINKSQSTKSETDYLSFTSFLKGEDVYFFINAKDKIKKLSNDRIEFRDARKGKLNVDLLRVSANGDFDFVELLDDEQNEVPFMIANGVFYDNTVFFLGRRGAKKQLLKVVL